MVRGSAGLFFDRVPLRALANALLSAGNTTDLNNLRQISISLSPTQAGAPVFPNILSAAVPSVTLVNLTTMDRDLQNAYSRQASVEVERQLGEHGTCSVGYQYVRGHEPDHVREPERAHVRGGRGPTTDAGRIRTYANNSQYSSVADSNYHGLHLSFVQRPRTMGKLPRQLYLLEVDEQRGREFLQLSHRSVRSLEGLGPVRR